VVKHPGASVSCHDRLDLLAQGDDPAITGEPPEERACPVPLRLVPPRLRGRPQ